MDRILNTLKCANCREILQSPVILPCNHTICEKHISNQNKDVIKCDKCGVEHRIPTNGFQQEIALRELIEIGIANLDFGSVHNKAKKSCQSFEDLLEEIEVILKDPFVHSHEKISELKNSVQLKGEELKLIIDEEMKKLIDRLDEYERQSKEYLSTNEFKEESIKLKNELNAAQSNLDSWLASLNELKFDQEKWENIIEESSKGLKIINIEFDMFKNNLLLNKFDETQTNVNWFKSLNIDSIFKYVSIQRVFIDSKIINESLGLEENFKELLQKKDLNGRKWSLLYQGSRDGFEASNFHSRCDGLPNTLTIVKSTNGNIFGGYTTISWKSIEYDEQYGYDYDNSAFIFSLVNKENRPLLFEHIEDSWNVDEDVARGSVWSDSNSGPLFGSGHDLSICDRSNVEGYSYSDLGMTYTHPEYPKNSQKTNSILAGSRNFQVDDIEVFQIQE